MPRQRAGKLALTAALMALSGCNSVPASINPVSWWHDLQGGAIADQRPPPPGSEDPYPNMATVPDRPTPPDLATRRQIDQALVADRTNAQHEAASAPIPDPTSRSASPGLFGTAVPPAPAPSPAPNGAPGLSATLAAADAPPPTPAPVTPAPVTPAPATPVPSATAADALPREMPQGSTAQMGELPPLPTAPPAPANLPGAARRQAPQAPPAPPPSAPAGAALPAGGVGLTFAPGSPELSPEGLKALRVAIAGRLPAGIVVVANGDAAASDPAAQLTALSLAIARVRTVARALAEQGVPAGAIAIAAQAEGRGASLRLVNP